jgi:hypothetical protein
VVTAPGADAVRAMAWLQVQAAGGMGTVAGVKVAYVNGLIDSDEFALRMSRLPNPREIVHPSQLPS